MANILFELERLRTTLSNKGYDSNTIDRIVQKANIEIKDAFDKHSAAAMELAVEKGVEKKSADFINELNMDEVNMRLTTDSGNMDFSTPPYPNLYNLLKNAKPIKDGSGVYKVIPIGKHTKDQKPISANIYDAIKKNNAERAEAARVQRIKISPKGSKGENSFRTATSKQNAATQWVIPAKEKDFSEDVEQINTELNQTMDEIISDIIRSYEEGF